MWQRLKNISKTKPIATILLILVNLLVFCYQLNLKAPNTSLFLIDYGTIPNELIHGIDAYTLVTSMFVHADTFHLFFNMVMLWLFGDLLEKHFGIKKYILFYFCSGIIASLVYIFINKNSSVPLIGCSGAIAGLLGAYLILFPKQKITFYIFFIKIRVWAFIIIGIWLVGEIYFIINPLGYRSTIKSDTIAYAAHLGGFLTGIVWGFVEKSKLLAVK